MKKKATKRSTMKLPASNEPIDDALHSLQQPFLRSCNRAVQMIKFARKKSLVQHYVKYLEQYDYRLVRIRRELSRLVDRYKEFVDESNADYPDSFVNEVKKEFHVLKARMKKFQKTGLPYFEKVQNAETEMEQVDLRLERCRERLRIADMHWAFCQKIDKALGRDWTPEKQIKSRAASLGHVLGFLGLFRPIDFGF